MGSYSRIQRIWLTNAMVLKDSGNECRMCSDFVYTVWHLIRACKRSEQKGYSRQHDCMGLRAYIEVCDRFESD